MFSTLCSCHYSQVENDGITQKTVASRIYDYIVEFWASAFVVQDNILAESLDPKPFPMSCETLMITCACCIYFNCAVDL